MEQEILELQQTAITAHNQLILEQKKNLILNNKFNAALRCRLKIKDTYDYIYNECLSEDDISAITQPR